MSFLFSTYWSFYGRLPVTLNEAAEWYLARNGTRDILATLPRSALPAYQQEHSAFCIDALGLEGANRALLDDLGLASTADAVRMILSRAWIRAKQARRKQTIQQE